nr:Protein of uncharacterised function (DUF3592) [Streptococcus thermophilus]
MISAGFLAMAGFIFFIGWRGYTYREHFAQKGVRVKGRVVDTYLRETESSDFDGRTRTNRVMIETIEFTTLDGTPILGQPSDGVGELNRMGMTVRVIYDPESPYHFLAPAAEDGEIDVVAPVAAMLGGGFLALVALISMLASVF